MDELSSAGEGLLWTDSVSAGIVVRRMEKRVLLADSRRVKRYYHSWHHNGRAPNAIRLQRDDQDHLSSDQTAAVKFANGKHMFRSCSRPGACISHSPTELFRFFRLWSAMFPKFPKRENDARKSVWTNEAVFDVFYALKFGSFKQADVIVFTVYQLDQRSRCVPHDS